MMIIIRTQHNIIISNDSYDHMIYFRLYILVTVSHRHSQNYSRTNDCYSFLFPLHEMTSEQNRLGGAWAIRHERRCVGIRFVWWYRNIAGCAFMIL